MRTTTTTQARETFTLTLDAKLSLAEHISRGHYGYVNEYYTPENFTLSLTGPREIVLFDPKGSVSSEEIISRMKAEGFVPATLDDALAMGAQHPDRQKKNPIVFLGTLWSDPDGLRRVPVLDDWSDRRELGLRWLGIGWNVSYRFAAVRES